MMKAEITRDRYLEVDTHNRKFARPKHRCRGCGALFSSTDALLWHLDISMEQCADCYTKKETTRMDRSAWPIGTSFGSRGMAVRAVARKRDRCIQCKCRIATKAHVKIGTSRCAACTGRTTKSPRPLTFYDCMEIRVGD